MPQLLKLLVFKTSFFFSIASAPLCAYFTTSRYNEKYTFYLKCNFLYCKNIPGPITILEWTTVSYTHLCFYSKPKSDVRNKNNKVRGTVCYLLFDSKSRHNPFLPEVFTLSTVSQPELLFIGEHHQAFSKNKCFLIFFSFHQ